MATDLSTIPFEVHSYDNLTGEPLIELYAAVRDVAEYLMIGNPKRHDVQAKWEAFVEYGFTDPSKWDDKVNDGRGGLSHGNGRVKALYWAEQNGQPPPRGIMLNAQGWWMMPILFGVYAKTAHQAVAYSINHNNLTLAGGEFTALDVSRLYDPQSYTELLQELANNDTLPLLVDGDDLSTMIEQLQVPDFEPVGEDEQGRLDEIQPKEFDCVCPSCGHEFVQQY